MTTRFDILPGLTPTVVFETGTTFEVVPGGVLTETATTTYTLALDTGAYAITGQTATTFVTRKLSAATGSYALTGSAATLIRKYVLAEATGSYFLTGSSATPKLTLKLPLATGAYSLTGSTAATFVTRKLAATSGSYALTGSTATTVVTRKLAAATGAFALTGSAAQVFVTRKLAATSGVYSLTGQNATLTLVAVGHYTLAGDTGHYTLSGSTGTLVKVDGSVTTGNIYTVSGPQVVGYLPLQDGVDQVRAVNFPGSTVQRQTTDGTAGPVAAFQADFTAISVLPAQVTLTRASAGTYFDSSGVLQSAAIDVPRFDHNPSTLAATGLLMEEARTNLFLTSAVPANQTITVVNATVYTVSFYGTGSLTLTGAVAHTVTGSSATVLTSYTFTSGTTSLVVAVAGSVVYPNVEAGSFATSHIPTTGATATRSVDVVQLVGSAFTALTTLPYSVVMKIVNTQVGFFNAFLAMGGSGGTNQTELLANWAASTNQIVSQDNTTANNSLVATLGSDATTGPLQLALGASSGGRSLAANGGTVVTDANVPTVGGTNIYLAQSTGAANFTTMHCAGIAIYSSRLSDATLQTKSVVGASF